MEIRIQPLDDRYSPEVIALILTIQQKEFNIPVSIEDQPDLLALTKVYRNSGGNFWGAFSEGALIGTIGLIRFNDQCGAIRKMFVKKEYRGKPFGAAQQLLDTLFDHCRNHHIEQLFLGTVPVLKAAGRFYARNHFDRIEKDQLPSGFPLMRTDSIFYTRNLTR